MSRQKGIRLPYHSDAELEVMHRSEGHKRNRHYKQRQIAKRPCPNACFYAPGLGLIPETGCPIHDKAWIKAGEYRP